MSHENQKSFLQMSLPAFSKGYGNILESDLTEFAKAHDIDIHIKPVIHRSSKRIRMGGKTNFISSDLKNYILFGSPWTEWMDKIPTWMLTINEYKKLNQQQRPDWAKTYSERGQARLAKGKSVPLPRKQRTEHSLLYSVEGESLSLNGAFALRFKDTLGRCRRTIVLWPTADIDFVAIRKEDWCPKSFWEVRSESKIPKDQVYWLIDGYLQKNR